MRKPVVLITGAGPIGIMAAAVAVHAGARFTVITDLNPYRLNLASKMGVTRAVNIRETTLGDVQKDLGMTEGFDVGLEMSGNPSGFRDMVANMSHGTMRRKVCCGVFSSSSAPANPPMALVMANGHTLRRSSFSSFQ